MKKLIFLCIALGLMTDAAFAQRFLDRLQDAARNAAENAVTRNVERKVEDKVDDAFNGGESNSRRQRNGRNEAGSSEEAGEVVVGEASPNAATSSDFKRGEVILFEDDFTAEVVGEFPSKWDLLDGGAEVKTLGGIKAVEITNNGVITPLIKEQGAYLPEEFTIEYD
ncbi:MAG: hypothetical protein IKI72_00745, partial [Bacteroidales bacterium]|nr:hypothetical protein [Bacteroidales bacterium]